MPPGIVLPVTGNGNLLRTVAKHPETVQCSPHLVLAPHDTDELLHHRLEIVFHLVWAFDTILPTEWLERCTNDRVRLRRVYLRRGLPARKFGRVFTGAHPENQEIGQRVATKSVRSVQAGPNFAGGKQAGDCRHLSVTIDANSAHDIVGRGSNLHWFLRYVDI